MNSKKPNSHVETTSETEAVFCATSGPSSDFAAAHARINVEHDLGFLEATKLYPGAIGWSLFFSLGIIMLSYDPQVLGNLYASPAFQRDFGYEFNGSFIIAARWQTALSMGNPIGQVIGPLVAPFPLERYGRKRTFITCVILTTACIFIQFFARSLPTLLVGELLGGLVLGTYAAIAPLYSSEVCPLPLRGTLTSFTNMCFVIGQLIGNGVTAGTSSLDDHWAYSIPFAIQWVWPLIILSLAWHAPESPWWLQRQGRMTDATDALRRLSSPTVDVAHSLTIIIETDALEQVMHASSTYGAIFDGANRRRTEIAIGVYAIQVLSGIYLVNFGTYFFEQAGLPVARAFDMGVAFLACGVLATGLSWILILYVGRRMIYNTGLAFLALLMLLIGVLDCVPRYETHTAVIWAQSSLMLVWNFTYNLSIGPVCFIILTEVSATRVRSRTIAVATAVQAVLGIVMTIAIPYLIGPAEANLRGKLGFVFGGLALLCLVWTYLRVPETGGRTYEELDVMFEQKVSTRAFRKHKVR